MNRRSYSKYILGILIFTSGFLLCQPKLVRAEEVVNNSNGKQEITQEVINKSSIQFKNGDAVLLIGNDAENFSLSMLCKEANVPILFINKDNTWEDIAPIVKEKNITRVFTIFRSDRIFDFDYLVEYDEVKDELKKLEVQHKEISGEGSEEISYKILDSFDNLENILISDSQTIIDQSENLLKLYRSELNIPLLVVNKSEVEKVAKEFINKEKIKQVYLLGNIGDLENNDIYTNKKLTYIKDKEEFSQKVLGEIEENEAKEDDVKENDKSNSTTEEGKYPKAPVIEDIYVVNGEQTTKYYIYKDPKWNSKVTGYLYGSLTEVKILEKVGDFAYIETSNYNTADQIKGYIPLSRLRKVSPLESQSVLVDLSNQRIYVYENDKLVKEIICSTGKAGTDTPVGRFLIGDRGSSFSGPGYTCYNYVRFNNNYLFHSVLYHRGTTSVIKSAEAKLGTKASHGCIRLPGEDAKWFYNNVKAGTLVIIQE